ncbi:2-oxoacid:acceptor oxidoreductase family protein [Natranaerofaba carboxydovora]|uniref:2-oxoacid:acceptor oxidoreductase family protein n=1 Tax=Natranaerofaba carboxydovora TaxID=2742683 RepID=UPI001F13E608|nr:2-oxoacid:acceptor oxidoreductase family protein [Natranaerofaba carboxydovora]UMZ75223.1 Pyruvate synthase subunit PorC [Natranaerofaba carboxydovora]
MSTEEVTLDKILEIRWHARGGQGAVTAAKTLAEMSLIRDMFFQAFPEYGPERMGAPIQCFNRLSKNEISVYCGVTDPSIVLVVDPTLLDVVDVTHGMTEDGIVIVNTHQSPESIRGQLNVSDENKVYTVDATHISMDALGRFMPNIPMLGAFLKVTGLITLDQAKEFLNDSFGKKFPQKIVDKNIEAMERAYQEVKGE